ncbi:unnamed protein product [Mytilus edulis]|uniref:Uncharacterized protein n=1 Tax=Mytilus edulis TaxID=6550 RepID=A0A8S3Q9P3_MYTED|nr:unnamed protein product [Mytilus edulis]
MRCDVEPLVFIAGNNIAFGKPTKQLTTVNPWTSEHAVDGNYIEYLSGVFEYTHSNNLPTTHWLQNYDIDVIEHPKLFGDKWATFQKGKTSHCHYQQLSSKFVNATCPPDVKGRFVRIKKRSNAFQLCLCEVEVYGDLITNMTGESKPQKIKAYGFPGKVYNGLFLQ